MSIETREFDPSEHLDSPDMIKEYMNAVSETGDAKLMLAALGEIAKAKGMSDIAKNAGINRRSLYTALSKNGNPRFETVVKISKALGLDMKFV